MKKNTKQQNKLWKIWFYTLYLPVIFSFLFWLWKFGEVYQCHSLQAQGIFQACGTIINYFSFHAFIFFFLKVYFVYHVIFFIFRFFLKENYFNWKIFLISFLFFSIVFYLLDMWYFSGLNVEEKEYIIFMRK